MKGENNVEFAGKTAIHSTRMIISREVSIVKPSSLADFAVHRACSELGAAPVARLKALLNSLGDEHHGKLRDVSDAKSSRKVDIFAAHVERFHPKCQTAAGTEPELDVPPLGSAGAFLPRDSR
jgi:hypothetical protein